MPHFTDHQIEIGVFAALLGVILLIGFAAARWRRPASIHSLEEWGVGGRAFGNWVTWFLLGGSMFTAYTFVAIPALTYGAGAIGFFAIPFAVVTTPLAFLLSVRVWSVSHAHGFVTPAEFTRARFGSRGLAALVAVTGIVATMPYVSVQLISLQAVFKTIGISGDWPLLVAIVMVSICTFRSGLRAPALLSIAKDVLFAWVVLSAVLVVAMTGGWGNTFRLAGERFARTPSTGDGLVLDGPGQLGYLTLVIGSVLAIFAYPHTVTGILAAKDRATVRRNSAALPLYAVALGLMAMLGFFAIAQNVAPVGSNLAKGQIGDLNTVAPQLFHALFPAWTAGVAYAALAVAALIPAAVMSISAANLFTRSIYREYIRPDASVREEARVSRYASLVVKFGAVAFMLLINPGFSVNLQLIGGVIILQTIPAVFFGLLTGWFHRWALIGGLIAGLITGVGMLYSLPEVAGNGRTVVSAHFGGSSWPLSRFGVNTAATVYVGLLALAVNVVIVVIATIVLRGIGVGVGVDETRPEDYEADADDPTIERLDGLLDGLPPSSVGAHAGFGDTDGLRDGDERDRRREVVAPRGASSFRRLGD
jgi:SSS family solute:Na+ symporter